MGARDQTIATTIPGPWHAVVRQIRVHVRHLLAPGVMVDHRHHRRPLQAPHLRHMTVFSAPTLPIGLNITKHHSSTQRQMLAVSKVWWTTSISALCTSPTPSPSDSFRCTDNQCVASSGGLPLETCNALCGDGVYKCHNNQCVAATTGVSKETCDAVCGGSIV